MFEGGGPPIFLYGVIQKTLPLFSLPLDHLSFFSPFPLGYGRGGGERPMGNVFLITPYEDTEKFLSHDNQVLVKLEERININ